MARTIDLNRPVPIYGSKVTVNSWTERAATATFLGWIAKQELALSVGSKAWKSNLKGYLALSKDWFLAIASLKGSVSADSKSFLSKIDQSTYKLLMPVFLILNDFLIGCDIATIVGIGSVGNLVL